MLVSCVTITQQSRLSLIDRAIETFVQQTYPNKELVIVTDDGEDHKKQLMEKLKGVNAFVHCVTKGKTLGELRNISSDVANGEIVCQWDDDDFYHPKRIDVQVEPFRTGKKSVSFLEAQIFWFPHTSEIYIRDDRKPIPGTIAYVKNEMKYRYPELSKGEDDELMRKILIGNRWVSIPRYDLYVRVFHGSNTWHEGHHRVVAGNGWGVEEIRSREAEIRSVLKVFNISGVSVRNLTEKAFNA